MGLITSVVNSLDTAAHALRATPANVGQAHMAIDVAAREFAELATVLPDFSVPQVVTYAAKDIAARDAATAITFLDEAKAMAGALERGDRPAFVQAMAGSKALLHGAAS